MAALGAERAQLRLVGRRPQHRRRIELPVAGVQHVAVRRAQDQRVGFRDRMGDRDKLDVERPDVEARAERHLGDRNFRRAVFALALGFEQRRGERRRVDRHLQLRPQIEHRAVMVLVGVGEHDAGDVAALLDQIADVGKHQVDAGQVLLLGERHADVDDEPGAAALRRRARRSRDSCRSRRRRRAARTRARPADRPSPLPRRHEHVARRHGLHCPIGEAQNQAAGCRRCFRTGRQARRRPTSTRIGLPMPAARASQSARIAAKPAPRFHCARRAIIAADSGANRLSGVARTPAAARSVAGIIGAGRMVHAIDADADRDGRALALDQDAGELVAVDQEIVRPFQHQPRRRAPECVRRWRRAARAPRRTTARETAPAAPDR